MRKISTARSSRRAPPLKDSDYDHEISLVDHVAEAVTPQRITPESAAEPTAEPAASEHLEDPEHVLSPRSTTEPGQHLSKYTTAVESPAPGTPAPQAGPSTSTKDPSPSRSATSRRSTSSSGDSTGKSKKLENASKWSSLRRASRDRVAVPKIAVNGEHVIASSLRRTVDPKFFSNNHQSQLRLEMDATLHRTETLAVLETPPKPPSTSCTKTKEAASYVVSLCFLPRHWVSLTLRHGPILPTNPVQQISPPRKSRIPAGSGRGPNGASITT